MYNEQHVRTKLGMVFGKPSKGSKVHCFEWRVRACLSFFYGRLKHICLEATSHVEERET